MKPIMMPFYPGGHGPLWDLATDKTSSALIEAFIPITNQSFTGIEKRKKVNGEF
jgi:hypothetical protein